MTTHAQNQSLPNTGKIYLFCSNQSESCMNYKENNWPKLVAAAKIYNPKIEIEEIDVNDPKNRREIGGPLIYHAGNELPNTVFVSKNDEFLFAFRRNLNTNWLVREFDKITPKTKETESYFQKKTDQTYGFIPSYRTPKNEAQTGI